MKEIDEMTKVPLSKFRRELRKWMRYHEPILITIRGVDGHVVIPHNAPEFDFARNMLDFEKDI